MAYESFGGLVGSTALDTAQGGFANTGNYTTTFDATNMRFAVPTFECYHLYVNGPPGASFQVFINNLQWDNQLLGQANGWDPVQPMLLRPGDTIFFYWNVAVPNTIIPAVTAWFRYDTTVNIKH